LILFPCEVDGRYFENTRIAHRAVFEPIGCSYFRLSRALKSGKPELMGYRIRRVRVRYAIDRPRQPDDDGADLVPVPAAASVKKEHKRGEPLLCYPPGEEPLERGLPQRWH